MQPTTQSHWTEDDNSWQEQSCGPNNIVGAPVSP